MNLSLENKKQQWIKVGIVLIGVVVTCGIFLFSSLRTEGIGFPLDDAWIHQTYARNLAEYGEWSFIPGQPSAGSTAPLWSLLLAVGYLVSRGIPFGWTFLLGGACLLGIGLTGQSIFQNRSGVDRIPWAGLFLVGEWHLVWAAVSGMETAMMGFLVLMVFWWLMHRSRRWELAGVLIGVAVWIRPDGLTLFGPALFVLLMQTNGWRARGMAAARLASGFALLFLPYMVFNRVANGAFWPNTMYAKQAEYAALRELPFLQRLFSQFGLALTGPGLFLLPGFFYSIWRSWQKRDWIILSAAIWFAGYAAIYAFRLPVVYQHGRYLMPAMPVFFMVGLIGSSYLIRELPVSRWLFIFSRVSVLSLVFVWVGFLAIGARAYAQDVGIIQTEMVDIAHWVRANTSAEDIIAVHDIGAIGYFSQRRLVDLAGLVSPEVAPFIRDEAKLAKYLDEQNVSFLVTFPDWYDHLQEGKSIIYQTQGKYAREAGATNMAVYRWK
jgi:arabinofuranosyltransferase